MSPPAFTRSPNPVASPALPTPVSRPKKDSTVLTLQQSRVVICQNCGIEHNSYQKMSWKKNILDNQVRILQQQLHDAGHVNQSNELRLQALENQGREITALKQTIGGYQASLEAVKRDFTLANQALSHETSSYKATQSSLERETTLHEADKLALEKERSYIRDLLQNASEFKHRRLSDMWYEKAAEVQDTQSLNGETHEVCPTSYRS